MTRTALGAAPHAARGKAWQQAEEAYHEESRRYFVIRDASGPFDPEKAAAELTALRQAAQAAQDAYVRAVASHATQGQGPRL